MPNHWQCDFAKDAIIGHRHWPLWIWRLWILFKLYTEISLKCEFIHRAYYTTIIILIYFPSIYHDRHEPEWVSTQYIVWWMASKGGAPCSSYTLQNLHWDPFEIQTMHLLVYSSAPIDSRRLLFMVRNPFYRFGVSPNSVTDAMCNIFGSTFSPEVFLFLISIRHRTPPSNVLMFSTRPNLWTVWTAVIIRKSFYVQNFHNKRARSP